MISPVVAASRGVLLLLFVTAPPKALASEHAPAASKKDVPVPETPGHVQAKPPPFSDGIFPCSQCHAGAGDKTRRELAFHDDVQSMFTHDAEHRWCLDCHDNANRDVLHLSNGDPIPFTESYRLCGQCHGDKYRDWRWGVHGKRIGNWDGEKTYYLCVNCHNPHSPKFKPLKPMPVPTKPQEMHR